MANRFAVAAGNFNDTATWSTTAAGSPGASVPIAGDNAIANNFTVTINANATCENITNGTTYGGTAGGGFVLNNGITLTVLSSVLTGATGGTLRLSGTNSATVAAVTIASANVANTDCILHSGTGTLTVNSTTIQSNGLSANASRCINLTAAGTANITASTITGGAETVGTAGAILGGASSTITINGATLIGGSAAFSPAVNANGGICSITGNLLASTSCQSVTVISTTTLTVIGSVTAANGKSAISGSPTNAIRVSGSFIYSADGTPPTTQKLILNTTPAAARTRYALNGSGTYIDMYTADNTGLAPAVGDVRAGVVYGSATGTLAVPAANSVAFGVPVDNTTGTAVLTPEAVWAAATRTLTAGASISASDVWSHASRTLTTSSGPTAVEIRQEMDSNSTKLANLDTTVSSRLAPSGTLAVVTTLTNAPTVPSASAIASQVRTELSVELGRVDQAISTRAATGDIPTESEIAAEVWAKPTTELTITGSIGERAKNQSTVSTTGAQLAAALS